MKKKNLLIMLLAFSLVVADVNITLANVLLEDEGTKVGTEENINESLITGIAKLKEEIKSKELNLRALVQSKDEKNVDEGIGLGKEINKLLDEFEEKINSLEDDNLKEEKNYLTDKRIEVENLLKELEELIKEDEIKDNSDKELNSEISKLYENLELKITKLESREQEENKLAKSRKINSDEEIKDTEKTELEEGLNALNEKINSLEEGESKEEWTEKYSGLIKRFNSLSNARSLGETTVNDFEELKNALADENISEIKINENIDFTETLIVNRTVKITGNNTNTLKASSKRHFKVEESGKLTIENIIIQGSEEELTIEELILQGEKNDIYKGGIINYGTLNIEGVKFTGNIAEYGGAIYNINTLNIRDDSSFINNAAMLGGGAILNAGTTNLKTTKKKILFQKNLVFNYTGMEISGYGGAIFNYPLETKKPNNIVLNIDGDVDFMENQAGSGGAISSWIVFGEKLEEITKTPTVNIINNSNVVFSKNIARALRYNSGEFQEFYNKGGAIYNGKLNIVDNAYVIFEYNKAVEGGAIYNFTADSEVNIISDRGALFKDNEAVNEEEDYIDQIALWKATDISVGKDQNTVIKNSSFINTNKYNTASNIILVPSELKNAYNNDFFDDGSFEMENNYVNTVGNFITNILYSSTIDNSRNNFKTIIDKSTIKGISSLTRNFLTDMSHGPEETIEKQDLKLELKNSYIYSNDFILVKPDSYKFIDHSVDVFNNTFNVKNFEINDKGDFKHNTINNDKLLNYKDINFENNLIIGLKNDNFTNYLGTKSKTSDSKDEILFTNKDNNKNIYILKDNTTDLNKAIESSLTNYEEAGSEGYEDFIKYYKPVEKSLADGFAPVNSEELKKDMINIYRKDKVTLGAVELGIDDIVVNLNSNGGRFKEDMLTKYIKVEKDKTINEKDLENPTRNEYKFIGWTTEKDGTNLFDFNKLVDKDMTLYAKWEKIDIPVEPEKPENGNSGGSNRPHKKPNKDKKDDEKEVVIRPQIENTLLHKAYLSGYEDGTIRPKESITREEASAVLDRVTENKPMTKMIYNYKDVEQNRWSYNNINNLSNKGGIKGYPDGNFKPVNKITRAEAATILVRLENAKGSNKNIPEEIKNHWAKEEINIAIEKGWIKGYEDGSIKPNAFITRAEFVTLVNRMQNRKVSSNKIEEEIVPSIESYKDLDKNAWYYEDILEATNTHNYREERLEDGS